MRDVKFNFIMVKGEQISKKTIKVSHIISDLKEIAEGICIEVVKECDFINWIVRDENDKVLDLGTIHNKY